MYRSDHVVRDMLEAGDVVGLRGVAHELRQMGTAEAEAASWTIGPIIPFAPVQTV